MPSKENKEIPLWVEFVEKPSGAASPFYHQDQRAGSGPASCSRGRSA